MAKNTPNLVDLVRQSESFVVRDYTHFVNSTTLGESQDPVVSVIPSSALFEVLQEAHVHNRKITIAPVGPTIIDWS